MNSYDQYADQLLNSVFENAKQTTVPSPPIQQSPEDQFFNQLLARISSPAPFNNTNNEWLLLQQLQQQKQLLERQQLLTALSPTLSGLPITQPNTGSNNAATDTPSSPNVADTPLFPATTTSDEKVKKIARVPVQVPSPAPAPAPAPAIVSKPHEKENDMPIDALVKATAAAALSSHATPKSKAMPDTAKPALQKKKSFLKRTWSRREFKGKQPIPQAQKPAHKQENVPAPKKKATSVKTVPSPPQQMVAEKSSFWKPREEKPKGWWKGNRESKAQPHAYYEEAIEYEEQEIPDYQEEEDFTEEEEVIPVITPSSSKQTKRVVVKRVIVPKKVPSISKPKRPMAFKTPTPRKPKSKSSKKKKNEATLSKSSSTTAAPRRSMPMYVMPQQPAYYPQPMIMPSVPQPYMMGGGGGYYMMSPNGAMGQPTMMQQLHEDIDVQEKRPANLSRKKSVYNPREASNDKCNIM
ncbi:hypothetical protein HMPREF1544_09102 [Mucor circinelloides 1006PhL]|uniref:Uncharacterized protein n=1 Tax=Mucor circinelloides f. circinelloides (strain 1006PhL) TaxID=1220926 RepID=S2J392_MUCC1|nr:hypothetical protein HMPREF1544_09102 [Mucor circinelloides 1006PhL]